MVAIGDENVDNEVSVENPQGEVKPSEQVEKKEENPDQNAPEEESDKNEKKESEDVKPKDSQHKEVPKDEEKVVEKKTPAETKEGHLLMPTDSKMKFVQDSFGFSNEKTTFEAPKFHPYLLMKNYTVQYMDPIIKKTKPRRCLCCY